MSKKFKPGVHLLVRSVLKIHQTPKYFENILKLT